MYSLTQEDVVILFDIYNEKPNLTPPEVIEEFLARKSKNIYIRCIAKIQKFENEKNKEPNYIFLSEKTFSDLKSYVYGTGKFCLVREIGSDITYLRGCKVCIADIEDDEIFVVGEN